MKIALALQIQNARLACPEKEGMDLKGRIK